MWNEQNFVSMTIKQKSNVDAGSFFRFQWGFWLWGFIQRWRRGGRWGPILNHESESYHQPWLIPGCDWERNSTIHFAQNPESFKLAFKLAYCGIDAFEHATWVWCTRIWMVSSNCMWVSLSSTYKWHQHADGRGVLLGSLPRCLATRILALVT